MVFLLPTAFAQTPDAPIFNTMQILPDGTVLDENGDEIVFVKTWQLSQTDEIIQVQLEKGKVVFQKDSGAVTVFDENEIVIKSDSYVVRGAEINTDVWSNLSVNDSPVTFTIEESEYTATITFTRENNEGKFDVETIIGNEDSKTTAKFTNYIYNNYKFAFTETLDFPDNLVKLNSQDIDLTLYAGQSFPREVLEGNMDLILQAKEIYFNAGLGFDYLWQVNISADNKVSLDWANVGERLTGIGETVELDPTYSFQMGSGVAGNGQLAYPSTKVAFDSSGNVWVAAFNNHTVVKFDSSGNYLSHIGTQGVSGNGNYDFFRPNGVAVDSSDNLYVTDYSNHRVQKFDSSGNYVLTIGSGTSSSSNGQFNLPFSIGFDSSGDLWVGEQSGSRVQKFNPSTGAYLGVTLGTSGTAGSANGQFNRALGFDFDPATGNIWVADMINQRIQEFNSSTGNYISSIGVPTSPPSSGSGNYWFYYPQDVVFDPNGDMLVSDSQNNRLQKYDPATGNYIGTYFGIGGSGNGQFSTIYGAAFDSSGKLYVTDRYNHRIQVFEFVTAPSSPTNLIATQTIANQITLNWTAPSSGSAPASYEVYLNGSLIDTIGNVTTYTDNITGAEIGASLTYMVEAINSAGSATSNNSIIASWDVPDAPTGFQAVTGSPITMSWVTPLSDDTVTNFKIYRDGTLIDTVGVVNSYADNTTVSGNSYSYTASAVSAVGEGSQSSSSNATAGIAPDAPTNLTSVISNPNPSPLTISLDWDAPVNMGTAGSLSGYEVYRDGILITTIGTTSLYDDTVPNSGTFVYTIKAISAHGASVDSGSSSITTPTQPTSSSVTLAIDNPNPNPLDITATFVAPTSDGGSAVTGYNLFSSPDDVTYTQVATAVTTPQTITVANAGTWYFKSQAINNVGTGVTGSAVSITTATIPGTINDLLATPISQTQIDLTWSTPSNGGSNIVEYKIIRDGVQIATTPTLNYSDTTVLTQTSYTFEIITNNNVGDSANSNQSIALTFGVPDAPVVTVSQNSITSLDLSWTIPADYNSAITGYKIERDDGSGYVLELANTGTVSTTYTVNGLTPISEYTFRISAINAYGTGPGGINSNWTNPTAPTGLIVIPDSTSTNLELYWDANVSATGYKIERETGIGTGWTVVTANTGNVNTSYQDTGLVSNVFYNYRISTVTPVGNSTPSSTYAQTTFHLPDPVVSITADDGLAGTIALSWTAPAAPYGSILGYTIYQVTAPGTAATATAILSTTLDQISSITITDPGALYLSAPTVTISAPGGVAPFTTATATAVITGGVVTGITVTNAGDGYNTPPTVTISAPAGNTIVGSSTVLTPVISDTLSTLTTHSLPVADPAATYSFAVAPITVHGSTILGAAVVSISPEMIFEGLTIDIPNETNPNQVPIIFTQTAVGNNTSLMLTYSSSLNVTCETTTPFTSGKTTYANLAETPLGNGKVTHTMTFQNSENSIVDVFCFDQGDATVNGQARITQNIIPLKTQMDDFSNNVFGTGSTFAAIDLMTLIVVIVGMIGFNRKNPAVGLALMAGILGILSLFQIIALETTAIGGIILVVFLAIIMGLKNR